MDKVTPQPRAMFVALAEAQSRAKERELFKVTDWGCYDEPGLFPWHEAAIAAVPVVAGVAALLATSSGTIDVARAGVGAATSAVTNAGSTSAAPSRSDARAAVPARLTSARRDGTRHPGSFSDASAPSISFGISRTPRIERVRVMDSVRHGGRHGRWWHHGSHVDETASQPDQPASEPEPETSSDTSAPTPSDDAPVEATDSPPAEQAPATDSDAVSGHGGTSSDSGASTNTGTSSGSTQPPHGGTDVAPPAAVGTAPPVLDIQPVDPVPAPVTAPAGAPTGAGQAQTTTPAASAPAAPAAAASDGPQLRWAPPALSNPTTVVVPLSAPVELNLDRNKDYILDLGHLSGPGGLIVNGGHNVVMIGGQITSVTDGSERNGYAMRFYDQTGTVHIEGVLIDNSGDGITIQSPDAIFQIQNVRIANNHQYRDDFSDGHPDLIQTWSGPREVRIDRFTGFTDYQGFTWLNAGSQYAYPGSVTATNVNIAPLAPQPNTVSRWPDGSTRDKPDLGAGVWHVSRDTVFSCSSCYLSTGWWSQGYLRKLDDSIGGYSNGDGSYEDPYYEMRGADGSTYLSPANPGGGVGDKTSPKDLGRRQGDTLASPRTPNLANEVWTWGAPPSGDFVPNGVAGVDYSSPGYH